MFQGMLNAMIVSAQETYNRETKKVSDKKSREKLQVLLDRLESIRKENLSTTNIAKMANLSEELNNVVNDACIILYEVTGEEKFKQAFQVSNVVNETLH